MPNHQHTCMHVSENFFQYLRSMDHTRAGGAARGSILNLCKVGKSAFQLPYGAKRPPGFINLVERRWKCGTCTSPSPPPLSEISPNHFCGCHIPPFQLPRPLLRKNGRLMRSCLFVNLILCPPSRRTSSVNSTTSAFGNLG